jgi:hypothetical protein
MIRKVNKWPAAVSRAVLLMGLAVVLCCRVGVAQDNNLENTAVGCWRYALANGLGVRTDRLMLFPGSASIGTTSRWLWSFFDAMTTGHPGYYFNPAQYNHFSSDYGLVLYQSMVSDSLDPRCNLDEAIIQYYQAGGQYPWNKTIGGLHDELARSGPAQIRLDTMVVTASHDTMIIHIAASFGHLLVFDAEPEEEWYRRCVVTDAYANKSSRFWAPTFGSEGFMQYLTVAIVVADNATVRISGSDSNLSFANETTIRLPVVQAVVVYSIKDYIDERR